MTTNLAKSASNNGQIIKSGLPNDRRAKFLPSVAVIAYDWLRIEVYLGNVSKKLGYCTFIVRQIYPYRCRFLTEADSSGMDV
jgi:hypothetical protein